MKDRNGWGEDTYLFEIIKKDKNVQKEIFKEMIKRAEDAGTCHANFHLLGLAILDETFGDTYFICRGCRNKSLEW